MTTAATRKTTLRAQDLNCPSCVAKIEKSLNDLEGVDFAEVRFATGRIAIAHDPSRVTTDDLVRAVAEAGYTAKASAF